MSKENKSATIKSVVEKQQIKKKSSNKKPSRDPGICKHEFTNFFVGNYAGIQNTEDRCIHCEYIKK